MKLFGDRAAAGDLAALEHKRFQSGLSQIAGGDQAVMTATHNDDVVFSHSEVLANLNLLPVLQHLHRRVATGRTHNAASGMCSRAAHV